MDQYGKYGKYGKYEPGEVTKGEIPVIEKYKLPPIQIFDKNCPLKRVNQKFAIF